MFWYTAVRTCSSIGRYSSVQLYFKQVYWPPSRLPRVDSLRKTVRRFSSLFIGRISIESRRASCSLCCSPPFNDTLCASFISQVNALSQVVRCPSLFDADDLIQFRRTRYEDDFSTLFHSILPFASVVRTLIVLPILRQMTSAIARRCSMNYLINVEMVCFACLTTHSAAMMLNN